MLVAEMTRLSSLLQRHKIPRFEVDPACGQVVGEFQQAHVETIPAEKRHEISGKAPIATIGTDSVDSAAKCST